MMREGFISLHRKIIDWEWFKDINTLHLFIYCLLNANFTDGKFMGKIIPRGSFVTSLKSLSEETGLSIQNIKTSLNHLKSTSNLTIKSTNKYRVITVVNYELFQDKNFKTNKQTNKLANKQLTNNQQTTNNNIIINNKDNKGINIGAEAPTIYFPLDEKLDSAFKEYLDLRKKKKIETTERAVTLLMNKLEPYDSATRLKMVEAAIINNWKSFYPVKEDKQQQTSSNPFRKLLDEIEGGTNDL